jgi:hypothetical protein
MDKNYRTVQRYWNRSKDLLWAGLSDTASWLEAFLLRLQTETTEASVGRPGHEKKTVVSVFLMNTQRMVVNGNRRRLMRPPLNRNPKL